MTDQYIRKYYQHVSRKTNRELLALFRESVRLRYECMDTGWQDKQMIAKIVRFEKGAMKKVKKMLINGQIVTHDDFFRGAHFFQHSLKIADYAMAATLYAISGFLGDDWGKNHHALAIDRFLLSIKQPQIFGTQYERQNNRWTISHYREDVSDSLRKEYEVPPLKESLANAQNIS